LRGWGSQPPGYGLQAVSNSIPRDETSENVPWDLEGTGCLIKDSAQGCNRNEKEDGGPVGVVRPVTASNNHPVVARPDDGNPAKQTAYKERHKNCGLPIHLGWLLLVWESRLAGDQTVKCSA